MYKYTINKYILLCFFFHFREFNTCAHVLTYWYHTRKIIKQKKKSFKKNKISTINAKKF